MIKRIINIVLAVLFCSFAFAQNANQDAYFKALSLISQNQSESAILILQNQSSCVECKKLIAETYFNEDNALSAAHAYKELVDYYPSESYFKLSVIYAGLGFAEESVAYLEKHFEFPDPESYSEIMSFNQFEQINKSSEWKEFWSEERYTKKQLQLEEAKYLVSTGDFDDALVILESINYSSQKAQLNYLEAKIYFELGNWSKALEYVNYAIESKFDYVDALTLKRDIQIANESIDEAILTNSKLIDADIYNPVLLRKHAELLVENEKPRAASEYLDRYLLYFPNDEQATHLKTKILSSDDDYRNALINLNLLIEQNPSEIDYFIDRADIYYKLESWNFASDDYSMALDINPRLPEVWYRYGACQHELNNQKGACNAWERAANLKSKEAVKMLYRYCK